ncbi:hypothetical protein BKA70DRAFT_1316671 [Coprinopsis sp. MPI-PUGE-AT-0042]|nr:hypothetical protein BKA70DRAFT_1316671 [Coprinopsis sp. MPI-PUGE-AT-0042]
MSDLPPFLDPKYSDSLKSKRPRYPAPTRLPCANVQAARNSVCDKPGTMVCGACRLVAYCSPDCQRSHWKFHKSDCKSPLRSSDWVPGREQEGRDPVFGDPGETLESKFMKWSYTPVIDVLNLKDNENDPNRDYAIVLTASPDLADLMKTVNSLPEDYSGELTIFQGDATTPGTCRNIALLSTLLVVEDLDLAAESALHFWYSAFLPLAYQQQVARGISCFKRWLVSSPRPARFHPHKNCELLAIVDQPNFEKMVAMFIDYIPAPPGRSPIVSYEDAKKEYVEVRTQDVQAHKDERGRTYGRLRPSHRVAMQEYHRSGIILPHGAVKSHFDQTNGSLFTREGRWNQREDSDPLRGWDLDEVVAAGKRHGATIEDIYGCLYFFLKEQLVTFTSRLRKFKISITLAGYGSDWLGGVIKSSILKPSGYLPKNFKFDRIWMSNAIDVGHVELEKCLRLWAPWLKDGEHAVLAGAGWFATASRDVRSAGADYLLGLPYFKTLINSDVVKNSQDRSTMFRDLVQFDVIYDNSKPFETFLEKKQLDKLLEETKLKRRSKHKVVPHRVGVSLGAPIDALPGFGGTEESYYLHNTMTYGAWAARYLEFIRR